MYHKDSYGKRIAISSQGRAIFAMRQDVRNCEVLVPAMWTEFTADLPKK